MDQDADWKVDSVGPRNHVLDGGPDHSMVRGNFGGCPAHCKASGVSAVAIYGAKNSIMAMT